MPDVERVREKVHEYCKQYLNPIRPVFEISRIYDLQQEWQTVKFPYSDDQGCYVFYSEDLKLLYIGKASLKHQLGGKIANYFRWDATGRKLVACLERLRPACFVQTIKVNEAFEAPSLEEFLLRELDPPANVRK